LAHEFSPIGAKEKQAILLDLRQACQEVKRQQQGILKEKTLDPFLDER